MNLEDFWSPPRGRKATSAEIAEAARDGPGIDAAMRRGVARALEIRRKLGLPIVTPKDVPDARPASSENNS
jgi:hypothetical protein